MPTSLFHHVSPRCWPACNRTTTSSCVPKWPRRSTGSWRRAWLRTSRSDRSRGIASIAF
ncbi:unnamed protein product, partial [Durusdinium trenchii]